ncbi:hypothetical protein [Escherichia phage vB_EcoS-733R5]|nr:hypothetical protein [Escherichia phage vB_EcoS-733R5]
MGDPKKKFSNLRRCEKRLGGGPFGLCRQGFDPAPSATAQMRIDIT